MALFNKSQKKSAENIFEKEVKPLLHEKDGNVHVIMINSFSKWLNQNFGSDDKYTTQVDSILTEIQNEGYEIVDVKLNSIQNQGLTGNMEGFHTLVLYK
ncbi:hypothetical protein ACS127_03385 [Amphibacillus sp. Q70]|uniref:hypothetical protein n=1 Tax=Amphibacillus sp. Q70 TaxID=3453416 RepID=UPI003F8798FA